MSYIIIHNAVPAGNTCPPLSTIENGGIIYSDLLLSIGVIAHYVCTNGWSLHGHGRYECSVDGVWIGNNSLSITTKDIPVCEGNVASCGRFFYDDDDDDDNNNNDHDFI